MDLVNDLYRLQVLDSEREAKRLRLAQVEAELGESDKLQQARWALEEAAAQAQALSIRQRDLELELEGLRSRTARDEDRLYGGAVKNPKELADLQAEVASLKRRCRALEDKLLEVMVEREEAEAAQAEAQARRDEVERVWSARQGELTAEKNALRTRLAELEQVHATLLTAIPASDLEIYEGLRRRKAGLVVVPVKDDVCGGCHVAVPASRVRQARQELTFCANCERILLPP